ncbi:hypothetical protein NL50_08630 [Clostridium acetobutylicum]|nr:hypothetical protein NL50_08630 [Clostridium acetobutylicum]
MLKCFFKYSYIPEVAQINDILFQKKLRLQGEDFSEPYRELQESESTFKSIKQYAIENNIEELANAQYVANLYVKLLCQLSSYFKLLKEKEYRKSWDMLQDCFDSAFCIGKYTIIENRYEIPQIVDLLTGYESLYPFKVFASMEMIITKSECSICGKPFQSLDCQHIKGNLYWGEVAIEKVTEIKEVQAIAMVSHPLDKRCVMELSDDTRTNEEKFQLLNEFLEQHIPTFQLFSIENQKALRQRQDIKIVGRNDKCPCGSGKKFKNCCGKDLYYEYHHYIIHPGEHILFQKN